MIVLYIFACSLVCTKTRFDLCMLCIFLSKLVTEGLIPILLSHQLVGLILLSLLVTTMNALTICFLTCNKLLYLTSSRSYWSLWYYCMPCSSWIHPGGHIFVSHYLLWFLWMFFCFVFDNMIT